MSADAAATDSPPGRSASRHKILIRIHLRSSAAESSCLRRQPGRPRPPPAWRSMPPGPPSSGTPQAHRRPPARSPATAVQIPPPQPVRPERQTIAAPLVRPPHPAPRPEADPPACRPSRHAHPAKPHLPAATRTPRETTPEPNHPARHGNSCRPPTRISPPQRRTPRETAAAPGRPTHPARQSASARRNAMRPEKPPLAPSRISARSAPAAVDLPSSLPDSTQPDPPLTPPRHAATHNPALHFPPNRPISRIEPSVIA
jgi:hypothetical protein